MASFPNRRGDCKANPSATSLYLRPFVNYMYKSTTDYDKLFRIFRLACASLLSKGLENDERIKEYLASRSRRLLQLYGGTRFGSSRYMKYILTNLARMLDR